MFFDEIGTTFGLDMQTLKNFSIVNVANKGLIVYDHNEIMLCTSCKIVLKCNKKMIYIFGQNLIIQSLSQTDFVIKGDIFCISDREVSLC